MQGRPMGRLSMLPLFESGRRRRLGIDKVTIALHLGQLSLDNGETLTAPMRTLRLVNRSWSMTAAEFLFELAVMQANPASFIALRALSTTDLARYVRICEIAICNPVLASANDNTDIVHYMKAALAVRHFTQLRELNLLFIHATH